MTDLMLRVVSYVRHRPWCPEFRGPGDCTCGLYTLLDSIRCANCGHGVSKHTDRDVADVVGWPCNECQSARCTGFRASEPLNVAARAVVAAAEPDDDFDGQFIEYLVPADTIDALRAALGEPKP